MPNPRVRYLAFPFMLCVISGKTLNPIQSKNILLIWYMLCHNKSTWFEQQCSSLSWFRLGLSSTLLAAFDELGDSVWYALHTHTSTYTRLTHCVP